MPKAKTNLEKMGFVDPDRKSLRHDELQLEILSNPEKLIRSISKIDLKDLKIESPILEYPVISKNNTSKFIVGYVDCMLNFSYKTGKFIPEKTIYKNEVTEKYVEQESFVQLCIEIKTKIEGFGDVLRQINTYKEYLSHRTVFAIASEDDRYKSQFESQGIKFYNFK